jgi:lysophospholipase L1-like esterase
VTRRRILALAAVVVLGPLVVLGVEVQLARSGGGRLDDEAGERPRQRAVRPGEQPLHVVWLGDSTSTGVGATSFTDSMAWRVAEGLADGPVVLSVLGRSGDQVHEVLDDQLPELADVLIPDVEHVVLVSIGANDVTALTRRPTFEGRYVELVDRLEAVVDDAGARARIVLVGIPDIGTAPRLLPPLRQLAGLRGAQLDDEIAAVARRRGLHHVALAERTSRTFSSDPDRFFSDDGYHPSSDGHGVWADAVLASLDP